MKSRRKYSIAIAVVLLVALVFGSLSYYNRHPPPPDFVTVAQGDAYTNLLFIASQLKGELNDSNRASFLAENQPVLTAARKAIGDSMEAPESFYHVSTFVLMRLGPTKKVAYALVAEGKNAEEQQRYSEAAKLYVSTLRLGERVEHGPLVNFLVGAAIERSALKPLETLLPKLSDAELAQLAPEIQSFNRDRITFDEIIRREQYFMAVNATNIIEVVRARFSTRTRKMLEHTRESHSNLRAQIEIVAATAAAIRFQRDNKIALSNLQDLAPKYLKSAPADPYSNGPLLLIISTNNVPMFYSVGPNKIDDKGKSDDIVPAFRDPTAMRIMINAIAPQ